MANEVDEKVLFAALQGELNSRVIARASVNTSHVQALIAFIAAYVAARFLGKNEGLPEIAPYFFSCIIPLLSFYFVSIYRHNDMQIGLLNKALRKIESSSAITEDLRFYCSRTMNEYSLHARSISNRAVIGLCTTSPFLMGFDVIFELMGGHDITVVINVKILAIVLFSLVISTYNIYTLYKLSVFRHKLVEEV